MGRKALVMRCENGLRDSVGVGGECAEGWRDDPFLFSVVYIWDVGRARL